MKTLLKKREVHYLIIAVVAGLATYAFFSQATSTEAVEIGSVGTLSAKLSPNPSSTGGEFLTLGYTGKGTIDMTGWTLTNEGSLSHSLDGMSLTDGSSVKLCSSATSETGCDVVWDGGQVWDNAGDAILITNVNGETVLSHSYTISGVGALVTKNVEVYMPIMSEKDSVVVCHSKDGISYSEKKGAVKSFATGKGGHSGHAEFDVIEPFFYRAGGVLGYHTGFNWGEKSDILVNGCVGS